MTIYSIGEIAIAEKYREQYRTMMREVRQRRRIAVVMGTEAEKKAVKMEYAELRRKFRKEKSRTLLLKDKLKEQT